MAQTSTAKHFKEAPHEEKAPKMGFVLHLCLFYWFINVSLVLFAMGLVTKSMFNPLDPHNLETFITTIAAGVALWLVAARKALARPWVIVTELASLAPNLVMGVQQGWNLGEFLICLPTVLVVLYFIFSKHAKAVLTQPFNASTRAAFLDRADSFYAPKTWPFWRNLIAYFCVFSVVGHWMEAGFCLLIKWGFVEGIYDPNSQIWSDWLYPFCVYGVGVCFCVLVFYPVKMFLVKHVHIPVMPLVLSFLVNMLVCSAIELSMGLVMNQPVNGVYPLWDYSTMPFNFMGQICLQNSSLFGVVATIVTWLVYPGLEQLSAHLPRDLGNAVFVAIVVVFAILFFLYCQQILIPGMDMSDLMGSA